MAGNPQLGTLLAGFKPNLFCYPSLVTCAAKVVARCADGELFFVGRSADSVYDFLSGVFHETSWADRIHLLPLSLYGSAAGEITGADRRQFRTNLRALGLSPETLARRRHPAVLVDFVDSGTTFENIFGELRDWIADERAQWDVIRKKLRFIGITIKTKNSPNTWRWQQQADWTAALPASAIRNVSMPYRMWSYFADEQPKLTRSFRREHWADEDVTRPQHDEGTRFALAIAKLLHIGGLQPEERRLLVGEMRGEPAMAEPWLRTLVNEILL